VSGGGPLSPQTHEVRAVVFGCAVEQGFGLTETTACCTLQRFFDLTTDNVGGLLPSVEIKTRDVDVWKHTNERPQGELLIRGPVVTKGYYKQPEKTAEAFLEDGWFATGDVVQLEPDGTLRIIGRVKALAKNSHGEYIALETLESIYVIDDLVMPNGVCVLVHPHRGYIAALVLTDQAKATKFAQKNGIPGEWPEILKNPEFHKKAAESLGKTAKANGRKPFEIVKVVRVLSDEWTPENDVLTAAMKLKRRIIDERYKSTIDELFKEGGDS
jgi:long-chain acyl-CoA synthetase